ncbi:unnamed protein product [Polarella glacialis]|uniref:Uncharacterized protein n=1 Tax=Polarella glacialis TaxID=89957 RepID=A0A813E4U3_POLGL|nr:unnamed protein product [Polarella glacialis]
MLWDRVCWRKRGDHISQETAHRDVSKYKLEGDEVFGGWLNLDPRPQFFHCVPASHAESWLQLVLFLYFIVAVFAVSCCCFVYFVFILSPKCIQGVRGQLGKKWLLPRVACCRLS